MDFLDKLNFLMETNGLNKNTLSKACDIPYTTIDGWYKKGYEGLRLGTLRKLANYFGTTLDFWIEDEKKPTIVSDDELWKVFNIDPSKEALVHWIMKLDQDDREKFMKAISMYSQLDAYDRGGIIERMAILLEQDKYAIRKTSSNGKVV